MLLFRTEPRADTLMWKVSINGNYYEYVVVGDVEGRR